MIQSISTIPRSIEFRANKKICNNKKLNYPDVYGKNNMLCIKGPNQTGLQTLNTKFKGFIDTAKEIVSFQGNNSREFKEDKIHNSSNLRLYKYCGSANCQIDNFYKVDDNLYRGGLPGTVRGDKGKLSQVDYQKTLNDIRFLRDVCGIKTILSLIEEETIDFIQNSEKKAIEQLNREDPSKTIKLIEIPLKISRGITDEQFNKLLYTLKNKDNYPIYVHCWQGRDRTGLACAIYRMINNPKASFDEIFSEMLHCKNRIDSHKNNWGTVLALSWHANNNKDCNIREYRHKHRDEIRKYVDICNMSESKKLETLQKVARKARVWPQS